MLSRKFFDSPIMEQQGTGEGNDVTVDAERRRKGVSSSSTIATSLSSDSGEISPRVPISPRAPVEDSSQMLRRRLAREDEFDFDIPGAYDR